MLGHPSLASVETFLNNYSCPSMCLQIENVISAQLICFSAPAPAKLCLNSGGDCLHSSAFSIIPSYIKVNFQNYDIQFLKSDDCSGGEARMDVTMTAVPV